ncbi:hypothetical protein [Clostridium sp. ZS2-4]|uniref:hypothetical protein n=1 Tax=Clostridium sp. ZS2-4 TaxID=2987703 RepID=UPI00227BDECA|nr:hypothetical protein [Clostridium sp. ZS2-4]MCY6356059.1 hypothetical protein [Clostridium sp. ZS2-4]
MKNKKITIVKRIIKVSVLVFIFTIIGWNVYNQCYEKLVVFNEKELKKVERVTVNYYKNLINRNFEEALSHIDYENASMEIDLEWLKQNSDYNIKEPSPDNIILESRFDRKLKQYTVYSLIEVTNGEKKFLANERLYFKKVKGVYKISCISTKDKYISFRSNENHELGYGM